MSQKTKMSASAKRIVRKVKQDIRKDMELKFGYTSWNGSSVLNTGLQHNVLIAQGTDNDDRIGNRCYLRGMKADLVMYNDTAINSLPTNVRVMVLRNKKVYAGSFVTTYSLTDYSALDIDDWEVIYDRIDTVTAEKPVRIKYNRRFKPYRKVLYDNTTGADLIPGHQYAVCIVSGTATSGQCKISGNSYYFYSDDS